MNSQKTQELTKEELEQVNPRYIEIYHCYIDVSVNSQRTGPASSSGEQEAVRSL